GGHVNLETMLSRSCSMNYLTFEYKKSDNLGDEIQSIASEQFLPRVDGFVDRDTGMHAVSETSLVIMNGWFKHGPTHWRDDALECWPPCKKLHAAFLGFHVAYPELLTAQFLDYCSDWQPIGCRDLGTMELLQERGLTAYFSRCLTLTFPRRRITPACGKVYIV